MFTLKAKYQNKRQTGLDLKNLRKDKEQLCKLRLETASKRKTPPWTMEQLETVLKYLKRNKSRDPFGYANEIFMMEVAGDDLKHADEQN